jgi:tellurium resistance protein TerD
MANLTKMTSGQRVNLAKENPSLTKVRIGLSWDMKPGITVDLDASVIICSNQNGSEKAVGEKDSNGVAKGIVYYNNLTYKDAVVHKGDNRDGTGEGDDETIIVDLSKISDSESILVVATVYSDGEKITFGRAANAALNVYNDANGEKLYSFDLTEDGSNATAIEMARFYKKDNEWRLGTLGDPVLSSDGTSPNNGLEAIVSKYQ